MCVRKRKRGGEGGDISHLAILRELTEHDNAGAVVLPDHPPEVTHCPRQRSLGCYVGLPLLVPLYNRLLVVTNAQCCVCLHTYINEGGIDVV